jgi:hypothetical protein
MLETLTNKTIIYVPSVISVFNGDECKTSASGFGGLVVSMLASGTQFRGFKPG